MLNVILWSILAVWVGIALLMLAALVLTLGIAAYRSVRDRLGVKGVVYCPVDERAYQVVGVPAGFGDAPFDDVRRCEAFERGEPRCEKTCLKWEQRQAR